MNSAMQHAMQIDITTKILSATFQKNLATLKHYMPEIHDAFKNYTPKNIFLTIDNNGQVNLVKEGQVIYQGNPKSDTLEQVELFKKKPRVFFYRPSLEPAKNATDHDFLHMHHMARIQALRENDPDFTPAQRELPPMIPYLLIVGIGLGYHLEALVQEHDIRHILVHEPDSDVFYNFLHVIDLEPILQKCTHEFRGISFQVGTGSNSFVNHISNFLFDKGLFNGCRLYLYRHYRSENADEACKLLHEIIHRMLQGWGFYEDELISIAHTLNNFSNPTPYLKDLKYEKNSSYQTPAFIIGNGPSLDQSIEFIKQHQDSAILFSSGSALRALYEVGITPDFHVEIERTLPVDEWLNDINDPDYLKQITIIGVNALHPKALAHFGQKILAMKPNDTGALLSMGAIGKDKAHQLYHCNPTVANGATASAVALGFETIYLFGVDFGFVDPEYHHSKHSAYYKSKDKRFHIPPMEARMKVKGNFQEEIQTNEQFEFSRFEIERLLNENPNVKCFNCSNGIFIQGTEPLPARHLNLSCNPEQKQEDLKNLRSLHTEITQEDTYNKIETSFFQKFSLVQNLLTKLLEVMQEPPASFSELMDQFILQREVINYFRELDQFSYIMCTGTITYFQSEIVTFALDYADEKSAMNFVAKALEIFREHINCLIQMTSDHYKDPHESFLPGQYLKNP